jgi:hypothetical protein
MHPKTLCKNNMPCPYLYTEYHQVLPRVIRNQMIHSRINYYLQDTLYIFPIEELYDVLYAALSIIVGRIYPRIFFSDQFRR